MTRSGPKSAQTAATSSSPAVRTRRYVAAAGFHHIDPLTRTPGKRLAEGPGSLGFATWPRSKALLFQRPFLPWGYSASPAPANARWRYRDQIRWHLAVIRALRRSSRALPAGPSPTSFISAAVGMPFAIETKIRPFTSATAWSDHRGRLLYPGSSGGFCAPSSCSISIPAAAADDRAQLGEALETVPGLDSARGQLAAIDSPEVIAAYQDRL